MEWLTHDWEQDQWIALCVGAVAGIALVVLGFSGLAEVGGAGAALTLRWAIWQIPPSGRSRASGTPTDGRNRLGQLLVAVLLVILIVEVVAAAFR